MVIKNDAGVGTGRVGATRASEMPEDLARAIERGRLTQEQLRRLIAFEASELGLIYDEVIERARLGALPKDPIGSDLDLLVTMLSV